MKRKLTEKEKKQRQEHIKELQERLETITDIKRRSFLQATINLYEQEIARGVGFTR